MEGTRCVLSRKRRASIFNEMVSGLGRQMLADLFANAIKYAPGRKAAVIEGRKNNRNGKTIIFGKDNGITFDVNYPDKHRLPGVRFIRVWIGTSYRQANCRECGRGARRDFTFCTSSVEIALGPVRASGRLVTDTNHCCAVCQYLETETSRLERIHADRVDALRKGAATVDNQLYSKLRIAESGARIDLDIARGELRQHKRSHRKPNQRRPCE